MDVSIVILTHNSKKTIERCIKALLSQTYTEFRLIIVDDYSTDNTLDIINSYKDKRITIVRNSKHLGIAKSRNIGLNYCKGRLVFFTDSDCIPTPSWLDCGVKDIKDNDIITGWTLYENPRPSFKHRIVRSKGHLLTNNIGFKRSALDDINGFDTKIFNMYGEDKDACFKILRNGGTKIFCESMIIIHQEISKNLMQEINNHINRYSARMILHDKYNKEECVHLRIIRPDWLLFTIFPPLLLLTESFRSFQDLKLLPFTWLGMLIGRIMMWKKCIQLRKFYI